MRIGHYCEYIRHQGGVSAYIEQVARGQIARGHDVYLFEHKDSSEGDSVPGSTLPAIVGSTTSLFQKAEDLNLDILNVHEQLEWIPDGRVTTVRTLHGHTPYCPSGSRHLKRGNRPCYRTYGLSGCLQGHFVDRCGSIRPKRLLKSFSSTFADQNILPRIHTITVSHFLKGEMLRAGYPSERIHVLHSMAPPTEKKYCPPPIGPPRIVFVGRIVPQKGLEVLLRGMIDIEPKVHLDVVGDGYILDDMKALTRELAVGDRVSFHGWLTSTEVRSVMLESSVVIVPSTWHEPAGLVLLEAAALGRPVIASRVGGIPEYALGEYSILVPPNEPKELARQIRRLLSNPSLAEKMGMAGRRLVGLRFSEGDFFNSLEALYRQAIQDSSNVPMGMDR